MPAANAATSTAATGTNPPTMNYLQRANQFLRENEPVLNLTKQGIGAATARRPGSPPLQTTVPQLPAVTPPPQLDRLAFLRAFGMQG
jgi:hypothetical protein